MSWRFRLEVRDVSGEPTPDAGLVLSTWTGSGQVHTEPRREIGATEEIETADAVVNATFSLDHARFAPLAINLVRNTGASTWRWTDPRIEVITSGRLVTVRAVLSRVRPAPLVQRSEQELTRLAQAVKESWEAHHPRSKTTPEALRIGPVPGVLRDAGNFYRNSGAADQNSFHLLTPDPLGDARTEEWPVAAPGWGRFRTTSHSSTPGRSGRIHMIEYGEVGTRPKGPRFLVGVWLPHELAKVGRRTLDFLVWFTPNTGLPNYPEDTYPYGRDYPYALMARRGPQPPYFAQQTYVEIAYSHWFNQHNLAYHMLAARRSTVIVIPSAPSSHFELWESPRTLMRMLKEICRWIPRDDDGRVPRLHPAPPKVGRVGVSGFSAATDRLERLLGHAGADANYGSGEWGAAVDGADFDRSWCELWPVDLAFHGKTQRHSDFLSACALWARRPDRQLRVYQSDYPNGRWDPRSEKFGGEFARAMRGGSSVHREAANPAQRDDPFWAVFASDRSGRFQALSLSKSYATSPGATTGAPEWEPRAHENMPRLCLGHAMNTSGFARLGGG